MKAPVKRKQGLRVRWDPPDKEWLEHHYITLGKSAHELGDEVGTTWPTLLRWLKDVRIPCRTRKEINVRHSERMSGEGNPAWEGGWTRNYHRKVIQRSGVPERCRWCGQERTGKYSLHLHHKDHDKYNGQPENLCWLCGECHRLETAVWNLRNSGKAIVEAEDDTITIGFPYLSEKLNL